MVVAWRGPVPRLKQWFKEGRDVHNEVTRQIAKAVQDSKLVLPNGLFASKHWAEYGKGDIEREEVGKRTVHANNYGMGPDKFALITGLPAKYAQIVQAIYFSLFPEVRSNYQAWCESCVRKNRTIWTPSPVVFRKIFYGYINEDLLRKAYAFYPQTTVGALLVKTLTECCEVFGEQVRLDDKLWTPANVLARGLDVRIQMHDSIGVSVVNNDSIVKETVATIKKIAEVPIYITEEDPLVIPMDFKVGPSLGDLEDYKLA